MVRWSYMILKCEDNWGTMKVVAIDQQGEFDPAYNPQESMLAPYLGKLGGEGWEVTGVASTSPGRLWIVLKRPV